jgi:hypothetical protein
MSRPGQSALLAALLSAMTVCCGLCAQLRAADEVMRDIPAAFAPFEYLVGRWKGQGIPKEKGAIRVRGWPETHSWAWIFRDGKPSSLTLTIEGGKVLATGKLSFDATSKHYRLEGRGPKPIERTIAFEGKLDESRKRLVLERTEESGDPAQDGAILRLTLWPNANFIRYTITEDRRESGAFQFSPVLEVSLTKEGESFAGGSTAAERPRCIVTGGSPTMTLSYQGQTFPICCTGCRDEFNDNPQKYIKKAALMLTSERGKRAGGQPAASRVSRFEDAFAGDVPDPRAPASPVSKQDTASSGRAKQAGKAEDRAGAMPEVKNEQAKPAADPGAAAAATAKQAARAATLLRLGRNLEKSGKTTAALGYFRQIVKAFPNTPAAKTAALRIKALDRE